MTTQTADSVGTFRVLLVDDHDLVRLGLMALFSADNSCHIEWLEAPTLADALQIYEREADIDLILLDLNLADCKGLHGLRTILAAHPQARVLVVSGTQDEFVVRQVRAMGAVGYLPKASRTEVTRETLLAALRGQEGAGRSGMPPTFFPKFPSAASYDRVAELGPRHLEILELVLSGCTNQEISHATGLSLGTVKNYVSTILLALDVKSRSHLISLFR